MSILIFCTDKIKERRALKTTAEQEAMEGCKVTGLFEKLSKNYLMVAEKMNNVLIQHFVDKNRNTQMCTF